MSGGALFAIGAGAALGAWIRWGLGLMLNPLFPTLPLGTLTANLIGGYLMGVAMGVFSHYAGLSAELRLLVTTGFLGGLTTYSTFSAEAVTLISRQQLGWAAAHIMSHLAGSLVMTMLGIMTINAVRS